ncbi:hypothetical protein DPMN_085036 [Dreissena polymorpha]|uniref:Uncharacterized protein n=1 Tax=Dreissena polymorpha TaxID=45954 RepID=A0A9D3YG27_DREPO|nr:hypothetical protein DPMN_085036 [Dreissena polymorpha]
MACHYTVTIQRRDTFYSYIISRWEETGFCGELWEGSSSQKTTVDSFGGEVSHSVEGPILVYSRDPCKKIMGKRRGNFSKPPTAPKGNIRVSEDNCAFEVRVEFQKKTLSPTLKDNRLLEEEDEGKNTHQEDNR